MYGDASDVLRWMEKPTCVVELMVYDSRAHVDPIDAPRDLMARQSYRGWGMLFMVRWGFEGIRRMRGGKRGF